MVEEIENNATLNKIAGDSAAPAESNSYISLRRYIRPLDEIERDAIEHAIKLCNGNVPKAAVFLDVAPSTLYRKIKQWQKPLAKNTTDD